MNVQATSHPEVLRISNRVHADARGHFSELYRARELSELGLPLTFAQDNFSRSHQHVLRGLHAQRANPQGKYVRVLTGRVFDVAVDLRPESTRYRHWVGATLDAASGDALWVPPGFAHGFLVLSEFADIYYKCTTLYAPDDELVVRWDDPTLAIDWPLSHPPILSPRDAAAAYLNTEGPGT